MTENTKTIPLTRDTVAIVDAEDHDVLVNIGKWHNLRGYAVHGWGGCRVYMHRFVIGTPPDMITDHINGNGLDNRKCNLRIATTRQNRHNSQRRSKSGYKGVYLRYGKWVSSIKDRNKQLHLGVFENQGDAARAYDEAARRIFGVFAKTNFGSEADPETLVRLLESENAELLKRLDELINVICESAPLSWAACGNEGAAKAWEIKAKDAIAVARGEKEE